MNSAGGLSPYGTMGQTGNIIEWMETSYAGDNSSGSEDRALRGDTWPDSGISQSSFREFHVPTSSLSTSGFRVASVPEPSSTGLLIGPCLMFLARRARKFLGAKEWVVW